MLLFFSSCGKLIIVLLGYFVPILSSSFVSDATVHHGMYGGLRVFVGKTQLERNIMIIFKV